MGENRKRVKAILGRQRQRAQNKMARRELEDLHSVLRRAAERAERNKRSDEHRLLMRELAALEKEMAETP